MLTHLGSVARPSGLLPRARASCSTWLESRRQNAPRRGVRHVAEREARALLDAHRRGRVWSELLTDRVVLREQFARHAPGEFATGRSTRVFRWCAARCGAAIAEIEEEDEAGGEQRPRRMTSRATRAPASTAMRARAATLDWEDDALLLRIHQTPAAARCAAARRRSATSTYSSTRPRT